MLNLYGMEEVKINNWIVVYYYGDEQMGFVEQVFEEFDSEQDADTRYTFLKTRIGIDVGEVFLTKVLK